jgi:hypothetical protein
MRELHEIISELREHPDCRVAVIYTQQDVEALGVHSELINWQDVEGTATNAVSMYLSEV